MNGTNDTLKYFPGLPLSWSPPPLDELSKNLITLSVIIIMMIVLLISRHILANWCLERQLRRNRHWVAAGKYTLGPSNLSNE